MRRDPTVSGNTTVVAIGSRHYQWPRCGKIQITMTKSFPMHIFGMLECCPIHSLPYVEHGDIAAKCGLCLGYEFAFARRDIVVDEERQSLITLKLDGFVLNVSTGNIGLFGSRVRVGGRCVSVGFCRDGGLGLFGGL